MPEPLEYASPSLEPLRHSRFGSDSLLLTAIWVTSAAVTLVSFFSGPFTIAREIASFFGVLTLMVMLVFIPLGFVLALFGITEANCRRTYAYIGAAFNGCILLAVLVLVGWR